jgi:CHASE1-domain containing sensor protein
MIDFEELKEVLVVFMLTVLIFLLATMAIIYLSYIFDNFKENTKLERCIKAKDNNISLDSCRGKQND